MFRGVHGALDIASGLGLNEKCFRETEMPVYFVQGDTTQLVKIGQTKNVASRLSSLRADSPDILRVLAVIERASSDRPYHRKFAEDWVRGEWFRPSETLLNFIATIPKSSLDGRTVQPRKRFLNVIESECEAQQILVEPMDDESILQRRIAGANSFEDIVEIMRPGAINA
jgi:Meiotically Up-regulated Gene 113 (MUG113) protein